MGDEKLKYVVVCGCTGSMELIALIDDCRPTDDPRSILQGLITVTSPSSQVLIATRIERDDEGRVVAHYDIPDAVVKARYHDANLTETIWHDGHIEWTLRCFECGRQAQMSRDSLVAIADGLAAGIEACPVIQMPDEGASERHLIQLGVLCDRVTRLQG